MSKTREQFKREAGMSCVNPGIYSNKYVFWLEAKLSYYLSLPTNLVARPAIVDNELRNKFSAAIKEAEQYLAEWKVLSNGVAYHVGIIEGITKVLGIFKKAMEK